jgi:hypothetical protein
MNRTIMQTDPTARHSPIGSFQRKCYLARAAASTGPIWQLAGLRGQDSSHGGVDPPPPPPMTVFLGKRLIAGASGIAGKQLGSDAVQ